MLKIILFSLFIIYTSQTDISIGGIFDLTGVTDINSADLQYGFLHAINQVNSDPLILPNHTIVSFVGSDFCSSDTGEFLRIQKESNFSLVGVVGPFCSVTAEVMLLVTDIYSVPVVSPSASSPSLSDNDLFPLFARTVNSDLELAQVWYQMAVFYEMTNVNVLYSSELIHFRTASKFIELCKQDGIMVQSQSFVGSYNHSFDSEIEIMRNTGVNYFFLASYDDDARNVFRTAHAYGITGYGYYWFGSDAWAYENMLSDESIREAILGSIVVIPTSNFPGYDTWLADLLADFPTSVGSSRTPYAYDAMLVFAKALHQVIEIYGHPFEVTDDFKLRLFDAILESDFDSITGNIKFNELGDRTNQPYDILNFQSDGLVVVGSSQNGVLTIDNDITWPGDIINDGTRLPPQVIRFSASLPYSNGWPIGSIVFPGLQVAIDEINSNNSLLPNFFLDFTLIDSECSGLVALAKFVDSFDTSGRSFLFHLGDGCSVASQPLAQLTAIWSMPMISWGSTSSALSDKETYPLFRRTVSPDSFQGQAWYFLVKEMGWEKVATINSNEDLHALLVNEFTRISGGSGDLEILTQEVFPGGDPSDISSQLLNIQSKGARIILLAAYEDDSVFILQEAKKLGMGGENGYVWIGTDSWITSSVIADIGDDWQGVIGLNPALGSNDIAEKLWETLFSVPEYEYPLSIRYPYTETIYDAAYAFALSLHSILEIDQETYLPNNNLRKILFERLNYTDFEGANGRISFDADGDRLMNYAVLNLQGDTFIDVGTVKPATQEFVRSDINTIIWGTGEEVTPLDHPIPTTIQLNSGLVAIFFILSILGLLATFFFMVVLIWQRKNNVFVAARVIFCAILLACGFISYSSIFILNYVTETTCWIYPWMVHVPLILAMSCILSKAWRVYIIFIKNKKKLKIVKITDQRLLVWIAGFLGVAGAYLTICMVLNPYVPTAIINKLNPEEQYVICKIRDSTFSIWPIMLIIVEGILIIVGVVLAYLTRRVELLNYNESSFIGICVYNLLFTGAILVPLSYLITEEQINAQFAILGAGVLLNISVLIFYFFISRIIFIINGRIEDSGGTGTSGTRNIRIVGESR